LDIAVTETSFVVPVSSPAVMPTPMDLLPASTPKPPESIDVATLAIAQPSLGIGQWGTPTDRAGLPAAARELSIVDADALAAQRGEAIGQSPENIAKMRGASALSSRVWMFSPLLCVAFLLKQMRAGLQRRRQRRPRPAISG
jgi:hypothetical protein